MSFFQTVRDITGWTDREIGELVGLSASAVQSYRLGTRAERLTAAQRAAVITAVEGWVDGLADQIEMLEMAYGD